MSTIAALALLRGAMWLVLFYFAIRHRSRLSIVLVLVAWTSNYLTARGLTVEVGITGCAQVALIVFLLIDRLDKDPAHVKNVLASQLHDARREVHDCQADRAAWEARAVAYHRLLEKHGINP